MHSENGMGKLELIGIVFNSVIFKLFIGTPENGVAQRRILRLYFSCRFIYIAAFLHSVFSNRLNRGGRKTL